MTVIGAALSTGVIVAIVVVVVLIALLLALLPRLRRAKEERQLEGRRGEAVERHETEAEKRRARADVAEKEAQRERAEADLHDAEAQAHDKGLRDDELRGEGRENR